MNAAPILPTLLPIFPLPRVILLPRVQLPLNIFEPRYLAMIDTALQSDRMIGMIQPQGDGGLMDTGCAGHIAHFNETDDGRYLITLRGISRFKVAREMPLAEKGFRSIVPDWSPYAADLAEPTPARIACRDEIMSILRVYLDQMGMFCEQWEQMQSIGCEQLIATLSVVCPFDASAKQSLLEADTLEARAGLLLALLEQTVAETSTCH
jgi:Lon protease-like protein